MNIEESIPYAKELNASEMDDVQVIELASNVKKYSLKDINRPNSIPRNQTDLMKIPTIYDQKP